MGGFSLEKGQTIPNTGELGNLEITADDFKNLVEQYNVPSTQKKRFNDKKKLINYSKFKNWKTVIENIILQ